MMDNEKNKKTIVFLFCFFTEKKNFQIICWLFFFKALTTQRRKQLGQLHSQTTPLKKKPQSIFERLSISKTKHNSIHKRQKVTPLSRTSQ